MKKKKKKKKKEKKKEGDDEMDTLSMSMMSESGDGRKTADSSDDEEDDTGCVLSSEDELNDDVPLVTKMLQAFGSCKNQAKALGLAFNKLDHCWASRNKEIDGGLRPYIGPGKIAGTDKPEYGNGPCYEDMLSMEAFLNTVKLKRSEINIDKPCEAEKLVRGDPTRARKIGRELKERLKILCELVTSKWNDPALKKMPRQARAPTFSDATAGARHEADRREREPARGDLKNLIDGKLSDQINNYKRYQTDNDTEISLLARIHLDTLDKEDAKKQQQAHAILRLIMSRVSDNEQFYKEGDPQDMETLREMVDFSFEGALKKLYEVAIMTRQEAAIITRKDLRAVMTAQWHKVEVAHILTVTSISSAPKSFDGSACTVPKPLWALMRLGGTDNGYIAINNYISRMEILASELSPWVKDAKMKRFLHHTCGMALKRKASQAAVAKCMAEVYTEMGKRTTAYITQRLSGQDWIEHTQIPRFKEVLTFDHVAQEIQDLIGITNASQVVMSHAVQELMQKQQRGTSSGGNHNVGGNKNRNANKSGGGQNHHNGGNGTGTKQGQNVATKIRTNNNKKTGSIHPQPGGFQAKHRDLPKEMISKLFRVMKHLGMCGHHFLFASCNKPIQAKEFGTWHCRKGCSHARPDITGLGQRGDVVQMLIEEINANKYETMLSSSPDKPCESTNTTIMTYDDQTVRQSSPVTTMSTMVSQEEAQERAQHVQGQHDQLSPEPEMEQQLGVNVEKDDQQHTFSMRRAKPADFDEAMKTPFPRPNTPARMEAKEDVLPFVYKNVEYNKITIDNMNLSRAVEGGLPRTVGHIVPEATITRVSKLLANMKKNLTLADDPQWRSKLHSGDEWMIFTNDPKEMWAEVEMEDITWDFRRVEWNMEDIGSSSTPEGYIMPLCMQTGSDCKINKTAIKSDLINHENQEIARQMSGLGAEEPYETKFAVLICPPHKKALGNLEQWDKLQVTALQENYLGKKAFEWMPLWPSSIMPVNLVDQSTPEKVKFRESFDESFTNDEMLAVDEEYMSANDQFRAMEKEKMTLPRVSDGGKAVRILRTALQFAPKTQVGEGMVKSGVLDFSSYYKQWTQHPKDLHRHVRMIRVIRNGILVIEIRIEERTMFGSGYMPQDAGW